MWISKAAAVLALLGAGAAMVPADGVPAAAFKCGNVATAFLIDGEPRDTASLQLAPDDVHAVRILCWNPADSTFDWKSGVGVTVVQISTHTFIGSLEARLAAVAEAQQVHFERHGRFASDLGALRLGHLEDGGVEVVLALDPDGWSASAGRPLMVEICRIGATSPAACELHVDPHRKVVLPGY